MIESDEGRENVTGYKSLWLQSDTAHSHCLHYGFEFLLCRRQYRSSPLPVGGGADTLSDSLPAERTRPTKRSPFTAARPF
jgi:hypothetical protein